MTGHDSEGPNQIDGESKNKTAQYLATTLSTFSAISVGTCLAWTSPALPILLNEEILTNSQSAWVGSLVTVGGFLGALPAGYLADKAGPKKALIFINIPLIISWALICVCVSGFDIERAVMGLCIARFLGGLAIGFISAVASMYVSQIAENSVRGTLGTFYQLQVTIGVLYGYLVGLVDSVLLMSILCGIIPFIFIATFMFMPESPVYLLSVNRIKRAKKSLQWLRGSDFNVQPELQRMQDTLNETKKNEGSFTDIISDRTTLKALCIVLGVMVFQQLSGINAVIFYTATIFRSAGSSLSPNFASIIIGLMQVLATGSSSLIIEKAGRRVLLLISNIVMGICLALLGAYFYLQAKGKDITSISWLPLASLAIFIVVFSIGYGPIPWILMGELVPANLKGISSGLAACTSWVLAFIVTNYFGYLVNTFGEGTTFWIFSLICFIGAIFVITMLPETKGKDIEMILQELGKKPPNTKLEQNKVQL